MTDLALTNPYQLIPSEYHADIRSLLHYLISFPYTLPTQCPRCGSRAFYNNSDKYSRIPNFRCRQCRKGFNQLTSTPFSGSHHLELWPLFAELRLAGNSLRAISLILEISPKAATYRDKSINQIMAENYPVLYTWWAPHQARLDAELSPVAQAQLNQLLGWLQDLITLQNATCPHCGLTNSYRKGSRPTFRCRPCGRYFNLLKGTPLDSLSHIELWPNFAVALARGDSNADLHREFGFEPATVGRHRQRFIRMMREKELTVLLDWITWQRERRYAQTLEETRNGNPPKKVGLSRLIGKKLST